MAKQEYEFTLILSGVQELTREVLDAFYEAGCDDALIGMRDGIAYAEFCREADSFREAVLSAIRNVESAGVDARVEDLEPDEFVTMSEIARRLDMTREGVRKRVSGERGPGDFPPPAGCLTKRSPLWRWTDVLQWRRTILGSHAGIVEPTSVVRDEVPHVELGSQVAVLNAALDLRRRLPFDEAVQLLQKLDWANRVSGHVVPDNLVRIENGGSKRMTEGKIVERLQLLGFNEETKGLRGERGFQHPSVTQRGSLYVSDNCIVANGPYETLLQQHVRPTGRGKVFGRYPAWEGEAIGEVLKCLEDRFGTAKS